MKSKCTLICDTRENHVLRHRNELMNVSIVIGQITTGDYSILAPNGYILAVIERKSLEDFAASLKDGRMTNTQKLIDMRSKTGCRIIYIIEGPAHPEPNDYFGNIPYKYIESCIFHMVVRDNITILNTKNSLGTAQMLSRFVSSMDTLCVKGYEVNEVVNEINDINTIIDQPTVDIVQSVSMLKAKQEKSDDDVVREMWSCFPGISTESASEFMRHWSISDIIRGNISRTDIMKLKMANGKAINKKAADSLCTPTKLVEIRLLTSIPGISHASATCLINNTPLSRLLSYGKEISIEIIGKNSRRLGDKSAENVVKYFNYKWQPQPAEINNT